MNIQLEKLTSKDFEFVTGETFLDAENMKQANALFSAEHNSIDNCHLPFWATRVQDVFESKAVTYSERDIEEQDFLGIKLISQEKHIIVSFGRVGEEESLVRVIFDKEKHADVPFTLGDVRIESYLTGQKAS